MAIFVALAGRDAVHICLCPHMATLLRQQYNRIENVRVASNAALVEPLVTSRRARAAGIRLGFLSNLVPEKGLDTVFEVFGNLRRQGIDVGLVVAGPAASKEARALLDAALQKFGEAFDYRGGVYGSSKTRFFEDIDIFLFPTRYANEAEPLVVLEALTAGLPVIATIRGCISADISPAMGTIYADEDYVDASVRLLREWINRPEMLAAASNMARARAQHLFRAAQEQVAQLTAEMARQAARS